MEQLWQGSSRPWCDNGVVRGGGGVIGADEKTDRGGGALQPQTMGAMASSNTTSVSHYHHQPMFQAPRASRRLHMRLAQKLEQWLFIYNVTTGLYMLDWWERCLLNALFLLFSFVVCYNSGHYFYKFGAALLAWIWCSDVVSSFEIGV